MATPLELKKQNDDLLKDAQNSVILKEHTPENLLTLLTLINPKITIKQVIDDNERLSAMKELMVAIHPNNYPYNEDAQGIFEDIQRFYDLCNQNILETNQKGGLKSVRNKRRRRRNVSPTSVVELVVQCESVLLVS